jgi:hypothetical protein
MPEARRSASRSRGTKLATHEPLDKPKQITQPLSVDGGRLYPLLWLVLVVEVALGAVLGVQSTTALQAGDTALYAQEALQTARGDVSWLAGVHNYVYPAFLALLHGLGLWTRLSVGVVQIALLYSASLVLMVVLSRCLRVRFVSAGIAVCGIVIIPAAAWSGYWLSESVAAPLLLMVLALWVLTCYQVFIRPAALSTAATVFALGLASGLAWMARPALIWVPAVAGLMVGLMILASVLLPAMRRHGLSARLALSAVSLMAAFLAGTAVAVTPQLALDGDIGHLLKLNLAGLQVGLSSVSWRYASNFSGCGPPPLVFSPLSSDLSTLSQMTAPHSPLWGLTGIAAHLASGWDPLPSPTYMTSFSVYPWILVTLVSGFVCAAPFFATYRLAVEARSLWAGWRLRDEIPADIARSAFAASVAGVLVFFGVTQFELLKTTTEFRYNLLGWLSAAVCLVFLIESGWLSRKRLGLLLCAGVTMSAFILIIGQMTLLYSPYWIQCR